MSDNNLSTRDMILQRLKGDSMQELVSLGTDYLLQQPIGSLIDEQFVVGQITTTLTKMVSAISGK